jgi:hypothetical protein
VASRIDLGEKIPLWEGTMDWSESCLWGVALNEGRVLCGGERNWCDEEVREADTPCGRQTTFAEKPL